MNMADKQRMHGYRCWESVLIQKTYTEAAAEDIHKCLAFTDEDAPSKSACNMGISA